MSNTIKVMSKAREVLNTASYDKKCLAKDLELLRLAKEYINSTRHWVKVANGNKTLKARKLVLAQGESALVAMGRVATGYVCDQLASPALAKNIRDSFSWFAVAQKVATFKEWDEVVHEFELAASAAIIRLDVLLSNTKCDWKLARDSVKKASAKVQKYSRERLPAVALTKAEKYEIKRKHYALRGRVRVNTYHLVSAAASISQRLEGTTLGTKLWLRLVRTTRHNHINRNAHNWNNRQDYLVRLPV